MSILFLKKSPLQQEQTTLKTSVATVTSRPSSNKRHMTAKQTFDTFRNPEDSMTLAVGINYHFFRQQLLFLEELTTKVPDY